MDTQEQTRQIILLSSHGADGENGTLHFQLLVHIYQYCMRVIQDLFEHLHTARYLPSEYHQPTSYELGVHIIRRLKFAMRPIIWMIDNKPSYDGITCTFSLSFKLLSM